MKFSGYTVSVENMLIGKIDIRQDRLGSGSLNLEKSSVVRNTIQCMKCHMIIISTYNVGKGSQLTKYSPVTIVLLYRDRHLLYPNPKQR